MGTSYGKDFVRNDNIDGQGKSFLLLAKRLHIKNKEINRLYIIFMRYSDHKTHLIKLDDFLYGLKLNKSLIIDLLFNLYDKNKLNCINFMDYVIFLYSLLVTTEDDLARLCFSLFDIQK